MQNHHKQPEVWFSSTTSVVFMKGQTIQNAQKMMVFFCLFFVLTKHVNFFTEVGHFNMGLYVDSLMAT